MKRVDSNHGLIAVLLTGVLACAGVSEVPPAFIDEGVEVTEYRIGAADVVSVSVWKNPELSTEVPVLPDGHISVPLVGRILADGLTTEELGDLISSELGEYVTAPDVTVVVRQVNSKRASMMGGVNRSGPVSLGVNTSVLDALAMAGGFSSFADKKRVKVIRGTPEGDEEFQFNYEAFVKGKAPGTNVRLHPGDIVVVPD
ncbi:MAG: polysaccharide biosynthesis/export family protein [Myxococcota bacterium]